MADKILKQYIKTALEYGWAEANVYKKYDPCTNLNVLNLSLDDIVSFEIFYAKTKQDFIKRVLEINYYDEREDLIEDMKEEGYFEEDDNVEISDLLKHSQYVEENLPDDYIFSGEGYYDFWLWSERCCQRVDEITEIIKNEVGKDAFKRDVSDKEVEDKIIEILKN